VGGSSGRGVEVVGGGWGEGGGEVKGWGRVRAGVRG